MAGAVTIMGISCIAADDYIFRYQPPENVNAPVRDVSH